MVSEGTLLGLVLTPLGLLAVTATILRYRSQVEMIENARGVRGVVEEKGIRKEWDDDADDHHYTYYPEVRYTYEFEGEHYESEGIHPAGGEWGTGDRGTVEERLDALDVEEGEPTTVFVDPAHPDEGFLVRSPSTGSNVVMGGGGLVVFCIGVYALAVEFGLL